MNDKIRVAVVDDHPLFREGVTQILSGCPDVEVTAQGASAKDSVQIADNGNLDVLVLDVSIPGGGIAALESIVATHPEIKVLMLTVSISEADVVNALRLGASGYAVKGIGGPELIQAVRSVFHGDQYLAPTLGAKLVSERLDRKSTPKVDPSRNLSTRESEILSLVKMGLSNKAIGNKLHLSDKTVKHYMTNLFQKLRVRTRLEAALLASDEARYWPTEQGRSQPEKPQISERARSSIS